MMSRVLGSIGRFLITAGIVVLLFVAYQLWGTGLQEAAAQDNLKEDFAALLASVGAEDDASSTAPTSSAVAAPSPAETATTVSTTEAPIATTTTVAEFGPIEVSDEELAAALYRDGGEAIAKIEMPTIDVSKVVVEGVKVEDLRNGPGHYLATALPGHPGNTGIAGHRTTYGAPFNRIDELVPGDEFTIETVQGVHTYRVMPAGEAFAPGKNPNSDFQVNPGEENLGHIIVRPADTWVLGDFGDDRITLTACHPKLSAARRIIVAAELVSDPVVVPPPPDEYLAGQDTDLVGEPVDEGEATDPALADATGDGEIGRDVGSVDSSPGDETSPAFDRTAFVDEVTLDEGLDGDEGALLPAILWGLAAIAAYTGFKQLGRRWKMWPAIALGIIPVLFLTASAFEKVDRYLPAG